MPKLFGQLQGKIQQALERAIILELDTAIDSRIKWTKVANCSETMGHILICIAMICAFLAGAYDSQEVTIVSGCTNVVSLAFVRFSRYAADEAEERNKIIEDIRKQQNENANNESGLQVSPTPSLASMAEANTDTL